MDSADPFAQLSGRQRRGLQRGLRRAWKMGRAERDGTVLETLRERSERVPLSHVRIDQAGAIQVTEISFLDGCKVRLGFCHRPTISELIEATKSGLVTLQRIVKHGDFWGLYFMTPRGALPVIAGEAMIMPAGGGQPSGPPPADLVPRGGWTLSSV